MHILVLEGHGMKQLCSVNDGSFDYSKFQKSDSGAFPFVSPSWTLSRILSSRHHGSSSKEYHSRHIIVRPAGMQIVV